MQRMKTALGIEPARITNHYPTVGVTFGSARRPYAEVTIDNRDAEIIGQEGKTTTRATGNGKVPMQVVSRDLTLYVNGKLRPIEKPTSTCCEPLRNSRPSRPARLSCAPSTGARSTTKRKRPATGRGAAPSPSVRTVKPA
jgi:hypothetical protein